MMTRRARSVNRSNTGVPPPLSVSAKRRFFFRRRIVSCPEYSLRVLRLLPFSQAPHYPCEPQARKNGWLPSIPWSDLPCSPLDEPVGAVCAPGELGVVGRDEERETPFGLETHEQIEDDLTRLRIEVAGRLVGENGPRVVHQRARDGHPLLLTAR